MLGSGIRNQFKILTLVAVLFLGAANTSQAAAFRFALGGGANFTTFEVGSTSAGSKLGLVGGLEFELGLNNWLGISLGADYLSRIYESGGITESANYFLFPIMARFWMGRIISLGLGTYIGAGFGTIRNTDGSQEFTFGDRGRRTMDLGATAALTVNIPLSAKFYIYLQGKYNFGLFDVATSGTSTAKYNDIQATAGIRIGSFAGGRGR